MPKHCIFPSKPLAVLGKEQNLSMKTCVSWSNCGCVCNIALQVNSIFCLIKKLNLNLNRAYQNLHDATHTSNMNAKVARPAGCKSDKTF